MPMELKQLQKLVRGQGGGGQGKTLPPSPNTTTTTNTRPTTYTDTTTTPNKYVPYGVRLRLEWLARVRERERLRTLVEYTKDGLTTYQNVDDFKAKATQRKTRPPFDLQNNKPLDPPTKVDPVLLTVGETPREQQSTVLKEIGGNTSKAPNPVLVASCGIEKKFPKSKKTKIGQRISARSRSRSKRSKSRSSKIPRSYKTIPVYPTTPKMLYQSSNNGGDNISSEGKFSKKCVVAGNSGSHPQSVAARSSSRIHRRRSAIRRIKKDPSPKRSALRSKLLSDVREEVATAPKSLRSKSAEQDASTAELKAPATAIKPANSHYQDDSIASKVKGAVKRVNFQSDALLLEPPLSRSKSEGKRNNSKHKEVQVDLDPRTPANPNYSKDIYSKIGVTMVEERAIVKKPPIRRKVPHKATKMTRKSGGFQDIALPQQFTADSARDVSGSTQSLGFTDESVASIDSNSVGEKSRESILLEDLRTRLGNVQGKVDILPSTIDVISHKSNSTESIFRSQGLPKTSQQLGVSRVVSVSVGGPSPPRKKTKAKVKDRRRRMKSRSRSRSRSRQNKTKGNKGWRAAK